MTSRVASAIGRVLAVIVLLHGADPRACLVTVTARLRPAGRGPRLRIRGAVALAPALCLHLLELALPLLDALAALLGLSRRRLAFDIFITNCGAASALDRGVELSGFSLDVAVVLALISALLQLPLPQDFVCTGHLRSPAGEIGAVSGLDQKVPAAARAKHVSTLFYPALRADASLADCAPDYVARASAALADVPEHLRCVPVTDIHELLRAVCAEPAVLRAGLRSGYFERTAAWDDDAAPVAAAARWLGQDLPARFWCALDNLLLDKDIPGLRALLAEWARYYVQQRAYPLGSGRQLLGWVAARLELLTVRGALPLLSDRACLALLRRATPADYADVQLLQQAVAGRAPRATPLAVPATPPTPAAIDALLTAILSEISSASLAQRIGRPLDTARETFVAPLVATADPALFDDVCTAFLIHMLRHLGLEPAAANAHYAAETVALLERAWARDGGVQAARAEAATGAGLVIVLNSMLTQYKHEQQSQHVRCVLETTVNAQPWASKLALMQAWYRRVRGELPPELQNLSEAELTHHLVDLLEAYVRGLDRLAQHLRRL